MQTRIKDTKGSNSAMENSLLGPELVISGISGKLPESGNILEFQENLFSQKDLVTQSRWTPGLYGLPHRNGVIRDLDKFDAAFFGISAKAANDMDPMFRLLLELTFEAIFDAGVNPETLRGTKTGVFVGAAKSEASEVPMNDPDKITEHSAFGFSRGMFANGLSNLFNLTGPSFTVETACSSSLLALERAVASIRSGQCEAALVGGANLLLKPQASLEFHRLNMLSMEGKCKAFDASGNGYVRSEAVVMILIQKKSLALRSYATIINARTNADGHKEQGITYPSGNIQKQLLEDVYTEAGVNPASVAYVEAHGTGTKVGDPQELNAVADFFSQGRDPTSPLLIGSVKSNMGHSEHASGVCSLAKVVIAIKHGVIPGNLHFEKPNLEIPALHDGRLKVVDSNFPWQGGIIGINSFGFGGANVHVILKSEPHLRSNFDAIPVPLLVPLSGRTEIGIQTVLRTMAATTPHDGYLESVALLQNIAKTSIHGHDYRGFSLIQPGQEPEINISQLQETKQPIWFVFSGMGSQWTGMGRDLLKFKEFRQSFDESSKILKRVDFDLYATIQSDDEHVLENTVNSFVCIAAIQVGLVDLLTSIGIKPNGILGHSVGENVCAYADRASTREETLLLPFFAGGIFTKSDLPPGSMAAVGLSWDETKLRCPEDIHLACNNAKDSVSVAGPVESIKKFVASLSSEGVFAREIKAGQPFHSPLIASTRDKLMKTLVNNGLFESPRKRSSKWISTSVPESKWNSELATNASPEYFANNLVSPVLFQEALDHVPENALVIEIGPHALLQAILKRSLPSTCTILGLSARNSPNNAATFLTSIGKIYTSGHNPDISALYPKVEFPVPLKTPFLSPLVAWDHSESFTVANFEQSSRTNENTTEISLKTHPYLVDHKIEGKLVFPAAGYIFLVWNAIAKPKDTTFDHLPVCFEDVRFHKSTTLEEDSESEPTKLSIRFLEGSGIFEVHEGTEVVASGKASILENGHRFSEISAMKPVYILKHQPPSVKLTTEDIYKMLRSRGLEYTGVFQGIRCAEGNSGMLDWNENWISFLDSILQFQILRDSDNDLYLPTSMEYLAMDSNVLTKHLEDSRETGVPVHFHKNQNIIKCPGVELRGLQVSQMPRTKSQAVPTLEYSCFTPYFDPDSNPNESLTLANAVRYFLDLVFENSATCKLKIVEIRAEGDLFLESLVKDVIRIQPLFECEYILSASETNENSQADVAMIQKEYQIDRALNILKPSGFLFLKTKLQDQALKMDFSESASLISHKISIDGDDVLLFRKKSDVSVDPSQISSIIVSNENLSWIEDLKKLMVKDNALQRIYLVSENDPESGILGLVNSLRCEPGGNRIRCVFSQGRYKTETSLTENTIFPLVLENDLVMNVFSERTWGSYRSFPLQDSAEGLTSTDKAYLDVTTRGDLSSFKWIEGPRALKHFKPQNFIDSELCNVHYTAINDHDVELTTGKLASDQESLLGSEFSGTNLRGRRVMGIVQSCALATKVLADPSFLWEIPEQWTLEDAATVPVAYATAYYALIVRGDMRAGESVLIHSGSSGAGQAAIAIALGMNCKVFTTVRSTEKQEFLKSEFSKLNDSCFASSNDSSFEQHLLEMTKGRGVDLVLNSLSDEKLQASIRCLANEGRFLQIGKYDLDKNHKLGMSIFLKNVSFHGILLESLFAEDSYYTLFEKKAVFHELSKGIESGIVKPLPRTVFNVPEVQNAFQCASSEALNSKVLVKIRGNETVALRVMAIKRTYMNPEKSYIILGGLEGFGLELVDFLILRGATRLILVSKAGVADGYQAACVQRWESQGINITVLSNDVSDLREAREMITEVCKCGRVGGIFNLPLDSNEIQYIFSNQSKETFRSELNAKFRVTKNLDVVSRNLCPSLDHFVVFCNAAFGQGQTNQRMGNSAIERICESRQYDGLPALAIQCRTNANVRANRDEIIGENNNNATISTTPGSVPQGVRPTLETLDQLFHDSNTRTVVSLTV